MPPPSKPLSRGLLGVLGVLGIVLCLGMAILIRIAPQWTATARGRDVAVWVLTPHVAPGDVARLDVDVYGGKRAALSSIAAIGEGIAVRQDLPGANWGGVIMSKSGDSGHATETIELRVPPTAIPGEELPLALAVEYTLAVSSGSRFSNTDRSETVGLRLSILTPGERTLRRVWSGIWPFLLFGGAVALFRWKWHGLASLMTRTGTNEAESSLAASLGTLLIAAIILWAFGGWVIFALPLVAATGFTSDWFQVGMGAVWLFAPPLLARKLAGARPSEPLRSRLRGVVIEKERAYREAPPGPKKPPSLKKLAAALQEKMGLRVKLEAGSLVARRSWRARPIRLYAADPKRVRPEELELETENTRIAIEVVLALLPLLGPVELSTVNVAITIDGTRSADELENEWGALFAKDMLAQLEAMRRALPDRLGRRL